MIRREVLLLGKKVGLRILKSGLHSISERSHCKPGDVWCDLLALAELPACCLLPIEEKAKYKYNITRSIGSKISALAIAHIRLSLLLENRGL
jgi:hypothetical protein